MLTRAPLLAAMIAATACTPASTPADGPAPAGARGPALRSFASEQELAEYHEELVEELLSRPVYGPPPAYIPPPPPPPPPGQENVPVPEPEPEPEPAPRRPGYGGPMIRAAGDYLLAVREGRLASFRIAGGALEMVDVVDLVDDAGPGAPMGENTSFHELFVSGGDVVVLAHGWAPSAGAQAQATFYRRGPDGRLAYRGGWRVRAGGDVHRGNHVVRMEDGKLAFFDRREIPLRESDRKLSAVLPAMRAIRGADTAWQITTTPRRVHRPVFPMRWDNEPRLHVVTRCDPDPDAPACRSTAVYAPEGEIVHVSPRSAWVWGDHYGAVHQDGEDSDRTVLYRLPLDGSPATALRVTGNPRDPYSFFESADGHLNVLLLHDGWTEESHSRPPSLALLRLPVSDLGDGRRSAAPARYRLIPDPAGLHYNRFVGEWATYGNRPFGDYLASTGLFTEAQANELGVGALRWTGQDAPAWLPLGRATEAIEPIGERRALVVANNGGNLHLALIELDASPRVAARVPADGVGYFQGAMYDVAHRADGGDSGLIAVPFGVTPEPFLWRATSLAIYRYDAAGLRRLGRVAAREEPSGFGEVKPVFAQGRIFAMLGDELVEVAEEGDGLREVRRISLDFETRK